MIFKFNAFMHIYEPSPSSSSDATSEERNTHTQAANEKFNEHRDKCDTINHAGGARLRCVGPRERGAVICVMLGCFIHTHFLLSFVERSRIV